MSTPGAAAVTVVIGAGSIGQAIARRVGVSTTILLADLNDDAAEAAANSLQTAGFKTSTVHVDVSSLESVSALATAAAELGTVTHLVHTAGLSPAQHHHQRSSPSTWLASRTSWSSSAG
jgi:NADP-dependent 3-hydroxy acid dehydrogenase YdfG